MTVQGNNFGPVAIPSGPVPLREWDGSHGAADAFDPQRVALVRGRWDAQTASLLKRDRSVEENIRCLAGRQWDVWASTLGQFVDPTLYLPEAERRWRQRPVVNLLQYWFMLTHARITETPPIITFQPATADRMDAQLAEVMDTVFKTLWTGDLDMDDVVMRAAAWMLVGGEAYFETCGEYGPAAQQFALHAPATLSLDPGDGSEPITRDTGEPVPYDSQGAPMASLVASGDDYGYETPDFGAEGYSGATPAMVSEGTPKVRVFSPLEVRSEWGSNIPWIGKRWITTQRYLSVDEVQDTYGVKVTPDAAGVAGDLSGGAGALQRMLFGAGNFGSNMTSEQGEAVPAGQYVTVWTMYEKPWGPREGDPQGSPETEDSPGGRYLVVTPTEVLHDSARPYKTKAAGPIRRAQFISMPGRAGLGSTPLEQMVPLQKTYNRGWAQILEHRNRCTNPVLVVDANSGVSDQITNIPGSKIEADFAQNSQPAYYLAPPPLSGDVWRIQEQLFDHIFTLGSMKGAEGSPPTDDPSGELVAQLRFNADRPVSIAVRSMAYALAGVADDLTQVLKVCWPAEKVIHYAGDDNVLRTIQVLPEMWDGSVNVRPDITSAVPESQPAMQARVFRDWQAGAFGDPVMDPNSRRMYLELARYPNMNRAARMDGGIDRQTCERMLTAIYQGAPAQQFLPMMKPFYNYTVFLDTTRSFLAAPEYLTFDPKIQAEFDLFFEMVMRASVASAQMQAQLAAPVMAAQAAVQGTAARVAAENGPPQPDAEGESLTSSGPKNSGPNGAKKAAA